MHNKPFKIYVDIDGVLLTRSMEVPDYAEVFISFLVNNYECYWLTTHCRTGGNKTIQYLSKYYPSSTIDKLQRIQPIDWMDKKTEGIDYSSNFIWLDDYPFNAEKQDLIAKGCLDSLIVVNLNNQNELKEVEQKIIAITHGRDEV